MLEQADESGSDDEESRRKNEQVREVLEKERQERKIELNRWKVRYEHKLEGFLTRSHALRCSTKTFAERFESLVLHYMSLSRLIKSWRKLRKKNGNFVKKWNGERGRKKGERKRYKKLTLF